MARTDRAPGPKWQVEPVQADPCLSSPGYFMTRLTAGGAYVPCRLWLDEERGEDGELIADVRYYAEIDDRPCDPFTPPGWPWSKISEADWRFMKDDSEWCRIHAPDSPKANPTRAATESPKQYF